jgi:PadR family transcriptional regulator PadR
MLSTANVRKVAQVFLATSDPVHGYELMRRTDIPSGVMYPILARFTAAGWVAAEWDEKGRSGGPRRRLYSVTDRAGMAAVLR